jgi:DNA-binding XRE family transcriptional regulator
VRENRTHGLKGEWGNGPSWHRAPDYQWNVSRVPPAPDPALAAVLKRLRDERGTTQETLAFHAGITVGTLSKIELAQASPAWATIRSIAGALGVSLAELAEAVEAQGP